MTTVDVAREARLVKELREMSLGSFRVEVRRHGGQGDLVLAWEMMVRGRQSGSVLQLPDSPEQWADVYGAIVDAAHQEACAGLGKPRCVRCGSVGHDGQEQACPNVGTRELKGAREW